MESIEKFKYHTYFVMYEVCMMKNRTTIQIPKELKDELKELKKYKRETYEEILRRKLRKDLEAVRRKLKLKEIK